jgi:major membrane immunogen (membrane-anchored lipoprotein)
MLFGFMARRRRRLLLCSLLLLSGCGASFSNTPATTGTYNVTVTASGQSAPTHTQAFTLTLTQ